MRKAILGWFTTCLMLVHIAGAKAMTLEEYGVQLTSTGLVDTVGGLRWLDSDLTLGTLSAVDSLLDQGWRIATGPDINTLFRRDNEPGGDGPDNPLYFSDFLALTNALGLSANGFDDPYNQPWGCIYIYGNSDYCQTTTNWAFTPYALTAAEAFPGQDQPGVNYFFSIYLTEVPIYGNFETGVCETCIGRTLLVRNVPLPAGIWLMLSALGALGIRRVW